jgi:hypothetical protein
MTLGLLPSVTLSSQLSRRQGGPQDSGLCSTFRDTLPLSPPRSLEQDDTCRSRSPPTHFLSPYDRAGDILHRLVTTSLSTTLPFQCSGTSLLLDHQPDRQARPWKCGSTEHLELLERWEAYRRIRREEEDELCLDYAKYTLSQRMKYAASKRRKRSGGGLRILHKLHRTPVAAPISSISLRDPRPGYPPHALLRQNACVLHEDGTFRPP